MLRKYNLSKNDIGDRIVHLDAHNSKYANMVGSFNQHPNSSSFMVMLKKLEKNMHNKKGQSSNKDLIIQKRRLVSSQGKRFCAIKVNRFENIDNSHYMNEGTSKDSHGKK